MSAESLAIAPRRASIERLEGRTLLAAAVASPGSIYYSDHRLVSTPEVRYDVFTGVYGMKGDGSGKTFVSSAYPAEPSRLLHGDRWALTLQYIPNEYYPDGDQRREIFAVRLGGDGAQVQLTNDPLKQPRGATWSAGDSFISYTALTWEPVAAGGHVTDRDGQQWLADGGVFRADVSWAGGSPLAATPAEVMNTGLHFWSQSGFDATSDVIDLDWSPSGTQLAYQQVTDHVHSVYVAGSFDAQLNPIAPVALGRGRNPEWSPNGTRIAYDRPLVSGDYNWGVRTVNPDGSGAVQLTKTSQSSDYNPCWSPDGKQITFTRRTMPKGTQNGQADVMRVAATGGGITNLTGNLDNNAYAMAWRSDVQANDPPAASLTTTTTTTTTSTATWSSGSASLFSAKPVSDSSDSDSYRLLDLLAV